MEKIQQHTQVERLLETFATRSGLLPEGAYRIRDPKALPEELQQVLHQVRAHAWVSFCHGSRAWLFTGVVSLALSHERNAPVLQVNSYSEEGALVDVGAWTVEHDGMWRRCGD